MERILWRAWSPQESTEKAGGLANADVSDLERSDLETAAEAVVEN